MGGRDGEAAAALNFALAQRSAGLVQAVRSVADLAAFALEQHRSHPNTASGAFFAARSYASCGAAARESRSLRRRGPSTARQPGFFADFLSPPCASQLASLTAGPWQARVASRLASAVTPKTSPNSVSDAAGPRARYHDEAHVRSMFQELDTNGSGYIERAELLRFLGILGLPADNARYIDDIMAQYEAHPGAQAVSYAAFQRYIARASRNIAAAFAALDPDGRGCLTERRLLASLQGMGFSARREDALRMIELLDRDQDRCITYGEFLRYAAMLPAPQVDNGNVAFCWVDSADFVDGVEFRLNMVPRKQAAQRLFAGGLAGALSRSMVAPLERVRTILMASPAPLTMRAAAGAAWRDGGAAGLFKGNMASVVKVLPASAVQFAVYDGISDAIKGLRGVGANGRARIVDRLAAGVAAGAASCVATYPLDTVRTMMSVPGISQGGFLRAAASALQQRGLRGLYAGFQSSLLSDMLGTGLGFMAYETGNHHWERVHGAKPTAAQKGAIGAASALLVMSCTMPLEVIQRRMQVAAALAAGHTFRYNGVADAFAQICRREGFRAFYRGSLFAYAKVVPSIGAMYMLYELTSQALAIGGLRRYHQDKPAKGGRGTNYQSAGAETVSAPLRMTGGSGLEAASAPLGGTARNLGSAEP